MKNHLKIIFESFLMALATAILLCVLWGLIYLFACFISWSILKIPMEFVRLAMFFAVTLATSAFIIEYKEQRRFKKIN